MEPYVNRLARRRLAGRSQYTVLRIRNDGVSTAEYSQRAELGEFGFQSFPLASEVLQPCRSQFDQVLL
jgi:hypothetical protein